MYILSQYFDHPTYRSRQSAPQYSYLNQIICRVTNYCPQCQAMFFTLLGIPQRAGFTAIIIFKCKWKNLLQKEKNNKYEDAKKKKRRKENLP